MRQPTSAHWTAALLVLALGCQQAGSPAAPARGTTGERRVPWRAQAASGAPVAQVGDASITVADVTRQARATGQPARQALDELIRFELLAAEARREGIPLPPIDDASIRRTAVRRLLEQELEPGLDKEDIPESELRAKYEERRDYFVHDRLVQVRVLALFIARIKDEGRRAKVKRDAEELAAYVAAHPELTTEEFASLPQQPPWAGRQIASLLRSQSPPGPDTKPFSSAVATAVHALHAPGQTTKLISDPDGYYLARYVSERPPKHVSFEDARAEIVEKLHDVWRQGRFAAFADDLGRKHGAEVYAERLAASFDDEATAH